MDFDFELMKGLSDTVARAAGAVRQVADAFASLKGVTKSPHGRSEAEVEAAIAQVTLAIENANLNNRLLDAQVAMLADAIRKANEAQAQLDRYQLWETEMGNLVYRLKDTERGDEPSHFICPSCHGEGRRSILQGQRWSKKCESCESVFLFERQPDPPAPRFSIY